MADQPTTVPIAKVRQITDNIRELITLRDREGVTMAQMIRWCVRELRSDPNSHRLRGTEGYASRTQTIRENRARREKALLYLDYLATTMEKRGAHLDKN